MPVDIKLDSDGDLPASPSYVDGVQLVGQRIAMRLRTNLGEWILDILAGLPLAEIVQTKEPDEVAIGVRVRKEIEDTPGVVRITTWTVTPFSRSTRTLAYSAVIETEFGTLTATVGVATSLVNGSPIFVLFSQGRIRS